MARFNQFTQGKEHYDKQPNLAMNAGNAMASVVKAATVVPRKMASGVASGVGAVRGAMDKQDRSLKYGLDHKRRFNTGKQVGTAPMAAKPALNKNVMYNPNDTQKLSDQFALNNNAMAEGRGARNAKTVDLLKRGGALDPPKKKPTVFSNVKGGMRVGDMPGGVVDRGATLGQSSMSSGTATTSNGLEMSNSSLTPEETSRFMRNPGRPGTRMVSGALRGGSARPEGGWSPDYQKSWNKDPYNAASSGGMPRFEAPGQSGKATQATIASKQDRWRRDQQKFREAENLKEMGETGATERADAGNQNQLNVVGMRGQNQLNTVAATGANRLNQIGAMGENRMAEIESGNEFEAGQNEIAEQNAQEGRSKEMAWEGHMKGMSPGDAATVQASGQWDIPYDEMPQIQTEKKGAMTQSQAVKGLQGMNDSYAEAMSMVDKDKRPSLYEWHEANGTLGLYSQLMAKMGLSIGDEAARGLVN